MRLLVAYDGSPCAAATLTDLERAGLPADVHAIVLAVADVCWLPPEGADPDPALPDWLVTAMEHAHVERLRAIEQMRSKAAFAAERLQEEFPKWTVEAEACGDSPAWGILKRADEWQPDLIVLGSEGRSALGRFFLGSISLKVLNTASCSVRISRQSHGESHSGLRLLIGMDGSRDAFRTVHAIKQRHWPPRTLVRLVSAFDAFLSTAVISQDEHIKRWVNESTETETWVHRMISAATEELRRAGLDAEAVVIPGEPKLVLTAEAESWKADCVFLGAQGLNAFERAMLGSVSSAVATRAQCTVEIVRSKESPR